MNTSFERAAKSEEWLTPPDLLAKLGAFDLDPCSPIARPWPTATEHFTKEDDGLAQTWEGRCFVNPPYGSKTHRWIRKLAEHGDGIALIFARTETKTFFPWVWEYATGLLFLRGRLNFYTPDGKRGGAAGAPSVLIAYGQENFAALTRSGIEGKAVKMTKLLTLNFCVRSVSSRGSSRAR
jgi:hypothetical protein